MNSTKAKTRRREESSPRSMIIIFEVQARGGVNSPRTRFITKEEALCPREETKLDREPRIEEENTGNTSSFAEPNPILLNLPFSVTPPGPLGHQHSQK